MTDPAYKLVPVVPSQAQVIAAHDQIGRNRGLASQSDIKRAYTAMLAAAPEPPLTDAERENTVAFVQEWLMNADYDPTRFDRDFAVAIDARCAAVALAHHPAQDVGTGYVFWNPDSGEEYAPDHPIHSGEVCDAERIRRSTPQEDVLWAAFQGEFQRAHALETALARIAPTPDDAAIRVENEIADLKQSVIAFCAPWAVTYAREYGLPAGHLHPEHYDILAKCGARMTDFTRAALATPDLNQGRAE